MLDYEAEQIGITMDQMYDFIDRNTPAFKKALAEEIKDIIEVVDDVDWDEKEGTFMTVIVSSTFKMAKTILKLLIMENNKQILRDIEEATTFRFRPKKKRKVDWTSLGDKLQSD